MEGWCWRGKGARLVFAMKRGLVDGIVLCLLESERKLNRREMNSREKWETENFRRLIY